MKFPHTAQHPIARIDHGRRPTTLGVTIHDAETESLIGVRNYFGSTSPQGVGAHGGIDDATAEQWADLLALCYHAPGGNSTTVGLELMGFAALPRWRWLKRRRQLRAAANRTAWVLYTFKRGLPRRGVNVWAHGDYPPPNTHTDPGPNFPWPQFLALCRRSYRKLVRTNGRHWL